MHRRSASYGTTVPDIVVNEAGPSLNQTKLLTRRPRSAEPKLKTDIDKTHLSINLFPLDVHTKELHLLSNMPDEWDNGLFATKTKSSSTNSLRPHSAYRCNCGRTLFNKTSSSSEGLNGLDLASYFSYRVWQRRSTEDLASRCRLQKPLSLQRSQQYRGCGCLTRDHRKH